jgi:hypothetical protein
MNNILYMQIFNENKFKKKLHNNLVDSIIILTFVMSKGLSRKKQESRLRCATASALLDSDLSYTFF